MPPFNWFWFLVGVLFSMFGMPLISQILGRAKGSTAAKKVA